MIDAKNFFVINNDRQRHIKDLAYGGYAPLSQAAVWNNIYRLRRGFPVQRTGKILPATPQWKTLTLYSPTNQTAQFSKTNATPVVIKYPSRTV